jgi:AraC-like DNA-binding protein
MNAASLTNANRHPQIIKKLVSRDFAEVQRFVHEIGSSGANSEILGKSRDFSCNATALSLGDGLICQCSSSGWSLERNLGFSAAVVLPLSGQMLFAAEKKPLQRLEPTSAAVAKPFETINTTYENSAAIGIYLLLPGLVERAEQLMESPFRKDLVGAIPPALDLSSPLAASLVRHMTTMTSELAHLETLGLDWLAFSGYRETLLNLAVFNLFPDIAKRYAQQPNDISPAVVRRARDQIRERCGEPLEMAKLARNLGVSMRALQVNFKKAYGCSPRDYLRDCRLERARALLLFSGATTVTEAAYAAGFPDSAQFSLKYREKFGELPSFTLKFARR